MGKREIALAYVCLVGLPLLGLVGILHAGSHLSAPPSIRGIWVVNADLRPWSDMPCGRLMTDARHPDLRITQFGTEVIVTLNDLEKTVMSGVLKGRTLDASVPCGMEATKPSPNPSSADGASSSLRLKAVVSDQGKQRSLIGTLSLEGCANCPVVALRATPQLQ
jgi:hypothetical protein